MDALAPPVRPAPGRFRRIGRILVRVMLAVVLVVLVLLPALLGLLHFDTPRAFVIKKADEALASTFRGRLHLTRLERVDLGGARLSGSVDDPKGREVIVFQNVTAKINVLSLLWRVIRDGGSPSVITIDGVDVAHAEVHLRDDGSGNPTLAQTFEPRVKSAPSSSPSPDVNVNGIRFRHVWLHGQLGTSPLIDAELVELRAALGLDRTKFHLELERTRLVTRLEPYALNPTGHLEATLRIPLPSGATSVRARFNGILAETALEAEASLTGEQLALDALLPAVEQRTVARFAPDLALRGPLRVAASARGVAENLTLRLETDGAPGAIRAHGTLRLPEPLQLSAEIEATGLDASAVTATAPATRVNLDAGVTLVARGEGWAGHYQVSLDRSSVAGESLPDTQVVGDFTAQGESVTLEGDAALVEPGARATVGYDLKLAGQGGSAEADVRVELTDPPRLQHLAEISTQGTVSARGRVTWPEPKLSGTADVRLARLAHGTERAGPTEAHLRVTGPIKALHLDGSLSAKAVHAFGRTLPEVSATVDGTRERARVTLTLKGERDERLAAETILVPGDAGLVLDGAKVAFSDRSGPIDVTLSRAAFAAGSIDVEQLSLRGPGRVEGTFSMRGARLQAAAKAQRLDLGRLAALAGVSTPLRSARATFELNVTRGPALDGTLRGQLQDLGYERVSGGVVSFDITAKNDTFSGTVGSELVRGVRLDVSLKDAALLRLAQPVPALPEGEIHAVGKLDLASLAPMLASIAAVPIGNAKGRIDLDLKYARSTFDALPELTGHVRSHDLELVGKRKKDSSIDSSEEAIQAAPSVYRGIDFGLDLAMDAAARRLTARMGVYDVRGELLLVDASAGPWPAGSLAEVVRAVRDVPLSVKANMPARRLATLPPPIRPLSLRGTAGFDLVFDGTLAEPHLTLDARASRLTAASERLEGQIKPRLTVIGHVDYRRDRGTVLVVADHKRARALDASVEWSGDLISAASSEEGLGGVVIKAQARLHELDLEVIPALKNRQIEGTVSGVARVEYGPDHRLVFADVVAHPLRLGQTTLERLNVVVDAAPGKVRGAVSARGGKGALDANVSSGLTWPERGVPELSGDIAAQLSARQFRLGALWPLVSAQVNELDGSLDAELTAQVQDGNVQLKGQGRLADGLVQVPAIGQRFEGISATIKVLPTAIAIEKLHARGLTGELNGSAKIQIDEHLALREMNAQVEIEKDRKLPITVEGVALGDAWGKVAVRVVNHDTRMEVAVRVPTLHIEVPEADREGVQGLDPSERVRVGVHRPDSVFTALPVQPLEAPPEKGTPLDLSIELGSVWLKKGDLVNAEVTGKLHVAVAEKSVVTGEINLKGGSLDVQGKRFEIERGSVRFTGEDPPNPTVSAVARWDAPAGYSVYASYTGTAKKGSLTLRADPPLAQDEIVNLILFGTPEGSVGSGSGDTTAGAIGLAGGTAAKGLNRAISDFTKLDIQARVDTSTGSARPELMIPITSRVSARVTRAIGEPPPGSSPDRTFLTLELRLKNSWALSTMFGDRGASALDLIWRRNY